MDAYPEDYVNHNLPLVLLSGLEAGPQDDAKSSIGYPLLAEKGPKVYSDFPPLSGVVAEDLRKVILDEDGSQMPERSGLLASGGNSSSLQLRYRIKSAGRVRIELPRTGTLRLRRPTNAPIVFPAPPSQSRPPKGIVP